MSARASLDLEEKVDQSEQPQINNTKDEQLLDLDTPIDTTVSTLNESPIMSKSVDPSLDLLTDVGSPEKALPETQEEEEPTLKIDTEVVTDSIVEEEKDEFAEQPPLEEDAEFDDFGEFDNDFVDAADDDDFGDFDDFEEASDLPKMQLPEPEADLQPKTPTEAEIYVDILENKREEMSQFIENYLNRMWEGEGSCKESKEELVSSPIEQVEYSTDILNTPCSHDLWTKLSRDTVFYNPVTGAVGQFQWTRSETNKSYLNALGVTFNSEEKSPVNVNSASNSPNSIGTTKKRQSHIVDGKRLNTASSTSLPSSPDISQTHLRSASATGGLRVVTNKMDDTAKEAKKEADQELELDIDIARAYCELTEETIRIFPDVKLNAMVIELSRLQKQAADYLDHLLDQREQLKMDAETYNDLISCIVGHAQRLHVQSKDASPAMVSKKKKTNGTFSNIMRRKTATSGTQSASMGGGVVGVKQAAPAPKRTLSTASQPLATSEGRRSM